MTKARNQTRAGHEFDRHQRSAYPANPSLQIQFRRPVSYSAIRGEYRMSIQLEAPVIAWGTNGKCWAYLGDFDDQSLLRIVDDYRQATYARRGPSGRPYGGV